MRLIHTTTLELKEFHSSLPKYAILSHCWNDVEDEVSLKEFRKGLKLGRSGDKKIRDFCKQASQNGLKWGWVDTCCIDKRSSADLSENINSMFSWYQNADVCYAFMEDVGVHRDWRKSRWWNRGWTLQELIAPTTVDFFDQSWHKFGTRAGLAKGIRKITGIPSAVLRGEQSFNRWNIAQRLSWAAQRQTTRVEDRAYALLGLFQVNMPLLYGEGVKAFQRLQLELLQVYHDESLLAWPSRRGNPCSVLAGSPDSFGNCSLLEPDKSQRTTSIDPGIRRINPARVTSWGIEICVNARKLWPHEAIVVRGQVQKFLLAFPLTVTKENCIKRLPFTLVIVRSGPAPYTYERYECIPLDWYDALQCLERSYNIGKFDEETMVYLRFNGDS